MYVYYVSSTHNVAVRMLPTTNDAFLYVAYAVSGPYVIMGSLSVLPAFDLRKLVANCLIQYMTLYMHV